MKLILTTAAGKAEEAISKMSIPATIVLSAKNDAEKASLKKLKEGQNLYPYVTVKGFLGSTAGVFKDDPIDYSSPDAFLAESTLSFQVEKGPANLTATQEKQRADLNFVRFSYLAPPYLEITKVIEVDEVDGEPDRIAVQGKLWRARDQRLDYIDPEVEGTAFGKGTLSLSDVYATFDGSYIYAKLSAYAPQIQKMVAEQKLQFRKLQTLSKDKAVSEKKVDRVRAALKSTQGLLKAHAGELYDLDLSKGYIYYISTTGTWLMSFVPGLREIDHHDRLRLVEYSRKNLKLDPLNEEDQAVLREMSLSFGTLSMQDRFKLEKFIPVITPALAREYEKDVEKYTSNQERIAKLKPTDGPLGKDDLPGLKPHVELMPHQALLLASMKDDPRGFIDADPGAGKTLIIICDIIQQMKAGRCKRPLVLMPERLLDQFASEIREFSEFNPWIFNTEAVSSWKDGEFNSFMEDARKAPQNTIFLTSYNWISKEVAETESGEIHDNGNGQHEYGFFHTFPRAEALLTILGVDALYEDEVHILKGSSNQAWAASTLQRAKICRGLTGTIMPGNPVDVTGPMGSIHSGVFGSKSEFVAEYTKNGSIHSYQDDAAKKIRGKLKNFGTVSVRKSAWSGVLPKTIQKYHFAHMTTAQQKVYESVLTGILDEIRKDPKLGKLFDQAVLEKRLKKDDDMFGDSGLTMGNLLSRFTPLDQFLGAPGSVKLGKTLLSGDDLISPKAKAVVDIISDHIADERNGKVLVFVQYKEAARNLLAAMPPHIKEVSDYFEGGMTGVLNRLKNPDDPLKVLFAVDLTLRVGHNIQSVNCIIHADMTWLPGDMDQRTARSARPGQKREVYCHNVICKDSAEVLKLARMISAEHIIAKANSDFDDKSNLEIRTMNLSDMSTFRNEADLSPYLKRREEIAAHVEERSIAEREFYGTKLLARRGSTPITDMLPDAVRVHTPSVGNFDGRPSIVDGLIESVLNEMPTQPKTPRNAFHFHMQHAEAGWSVISYLGNDPKGYLRQFGFELIREHLYLEVRNRTDVKRTLDRLAKAVTIINREELDKWIPQVKVTETGTPSGEDKAAKKDKKKVAAEVQKPEVEIQYATLDGAPILYVDTASEDSEEVAVLKKEGFKVRPGCWSLMVTRTKLVNVLKRLTDRHPDVKFAAWEEFKEQVGVAFKSQDLLNEFDQFAAREK